MAAYAGLTGLVKTLLNCKRVRGIDVNCSNVHGVTPLYLAKLNIMRNVPSDGENNPWQDIADLIEKHGGVLIYPNRKAELHLLYKHLFGSFLIPFRLDTLNPKSEWFYESDVSQCTASDFDYYRSGTLNNPHGGEIHSELLRITKSLVGKFTNSQLVPRELPQVEAFLKIIQKVEKMWQIYGDSVDRYERIETEVMRRRKKVRHVNTASIKIPKVIKSRFIMPLSLIKSEQTLSKILFKHESRRMILSHTHKYIRNILHKQRHVFGDTRKLFQLLEKYEESDLCMEEIFQATMINFQFRNYVHRSRFTDLFSFKRCALKCEFATKRIPSEWLETFDLQAKLGGIKPSSFFMNEGHRGMIPPLTIFKPSAWDWIGILVFHSALRHFASSEHVIQDIRMWC